jgi:hypothetical protein
MGSGRDKDGKHGYVMIEVEVNYNSMHFEAPNIE